MTFWNEVYCHYYYGHGKLLYLFNKKFHDAFRSNMRSINRSIFSKPSLYKRLKHNNRINNWKNYDVNVTVQYG